MGYISPHLLGPQAVPRPPPRGSGSARHEQAGLGVLVCYSTPWPKLGVPAPTFWTKVN